MKPFLILQIRPIDEASDDEYAAFLKYSGLQEQQTHRIRMEKSGIPDISLEDYSGIILGGGPSNVSDPPVEKSENQKRFESDLNRILEQVFKTDFPFLGVCYGMGALAMHRGGIVARDRYSEAVGTAQISLTEAGSADKLLEGIPEEFTAYCGHKEACQALPPGAVLLAESDVCPSQMIRFQSNIYATQFHVELDEQGIQLRIDVYKNHGYFKPEDAEKLIREMSGSNVVHPERILQRFVEIYR
ncbi:MAG: glutamine amidotransferase [Flavobacteriaceae bacterium]|nr:glutamine amidotransferase [Bacteroidia bacterium]NNK88212.1 glutamine amidotransferase [Flavobacteriaceae bacterium]